MKHLNNTFKSIHIYAIDTSILSTLTVLGIKTYYCKAEFNKHSCIFLVLLYLWKKSFQIILFNLITVGFSYNNK